MRETGKFGISSGNTFHFGVNRQIYKNAARYYHTIKKTVILSNPNDGTIDLKAREKLKLLLVKDLVKDGSFGSPKNYELSTFSDRYTTVEMSLNKRKRWLLPEIINSQIDDILDGSHESKEMCNLHMKLVERAVICGNGGFGRSSPGKCTSFHDSSAEVVHVLPSKTYSQQSCLEAKSKGKTHEEVKKIKSQLKLEKRMKKRSSTRGIQRLDRSENNCSKKVKNWWYVIFITMKNQKCVGFLTHGTF